MKSTQKTWNVHGQRQNFALGPNATYIPLACVWVSQILGFASGVFVFLDTNMLVSFGLGDAKVWRWGSKPTPVPNANGFASQWNIGLTYKGFHTTAYRWIEKKSNFYLTYNTTIYPFWFVSYEGKLESSPAPVLSIFKKTACFVKSRNFANALEQKHRLWKKIASLKYNWSSWVGKWGEVIPYLMFFCLSSLLYQGHSFIRVIRKSYHSVHRSIVADVGCSSRAISGEIVHTWWKYILWAYTYKKIGNMENMYSLILLAVNPKEEN